MTCEWLCEKTKILSNYSLFSCMIYYKKYQMDLIYIKDLLFYVILILKLCPKHISYTPYATFTNSIILYQSHTISLLKSLNLSIKQ